MKYKIGDKVVYLKNTTMSNAIIGKEYIITDISKKTNKYLLGEGKNNGRVNEDDIKLVEGFKEGEEVYVSDVSIEDALKNKQKRIYICTVSGKAIYKHICVSDGWNEKYKNGNSFTIVGYNFIAKIPKEKIKERKIECSDSKWEEIKNILNLN